MLRRCVPLVISSVPSTSVRALTLSSLRARQSTSSTTSTGRARRCLDLGSPLPTAWGLAQRSYATGNSGGEGNGGLSDKDEYEKHRRELDRAEDAEAETEAARAWGGSMDMSRGEGTHRHHGGGGADGRESDDYSVGGGVYMRGSGTGSAGQGGALENTAQPSLRTAYAPSAVDLPESSFLKCIEKEITDEKLRMDKEEAPPPSPTGWQLHHVKGSSVIYGRRLWLPPPAAPALAPGREGATAGSDHHAERCMEKHFIRIQLTTRDPSLDPECDVRGEHFPFSFFVQRVPLATAGADAGGALASVASPHAPTFDEAEELSMFENSIEVRLDVVDGELVVNHVVYHGERELLHAANRRKLKVTPSERGGAGADAATDADERENPLCNAKTHRSTRVDMMRFNDVFGGYPGPNLDEAEEDVLDGIQSWLAERQIDDRFGEFVGQYSVWVEQAEYEQWLQQLYAYVAA